MMNSITSVILPCVLCVLFCQVTISLSAITRGGAAASATACEDFCLDERPDGSCNHTYKDVMIDGCGRRDTHSYPWSLPKESLDEGLRAIGGQRARRLLERLESGQPITVLALGGSITATFGGCWGRGCLEVCQSNGKCAPTPEGYYDFSDKNDDRIYANKMTGPMEPGRDLFQKWMTRFMQFVNMTFPHTSHTLYNRAIPATGPSRVLACESAFTDPRVDLVIVEFAVNTRNPRDDYRSILPLLMGLEKLPAILFVNTFRWCNPDLQGCSPIGLQQHPRFLDMMADDPADKIITTIAKEWDLSSVSISKALKDIIMASPVPIDNLLQQHGVHPQVIHGLEPMSIYISELLMHWLLTVRANKDALSTQVALTDIPAHESARTKGEVCYQFGVRGVEQPKVLRMSSLKTGRLPARYQNDPEFQHVTTKFHAHKATDLNLAWFKTGFDGNPYAWFVSIKPIDGPPHVRHSLKQGIVSVAPGAEVVMLLESVDRNDTMLTVNQTVILKVSYLVSYSYTGMAMVECLQFCTCFPTILNGRHEESYTGQKIAVIQFLTFSPGCRVRVLNALPSSEVYDDDDVSCSKFKILGLTVQTL